MMDSLLVCLAILLAPGLDPRSAELVRVERVEPHMGTAFQLVTYAPTRQEGEAALVEAFATIARANQILSDYSDKSEVMRLCAKAGGPPVKVSPELFFVLEKSQELSRRSEGAFDATVGPLSLIWRRARKSLLPPEPGEIEAAREKVGYTLVKLDPTTQTVQLAKPGMRLDFGGIGKGFAADWALDTLKKRGLNRSLVAAGGDITCADPPPGKKGWTVEFIRLPGEGDAPRFLELANAAVSTSGDLEKFIEIGGKRYAHILDPKTGWGTTNRASATVIAPRGIDADSLTKAILLMPRPAAKRLILNTPGSSGRLVTPKDPDHPEKGAEVEILGPFPMLKGAD